MEVGVVKKNPISNQSFGECTKLWESDCRDTLGVKRTNQLFYFFFSLSNTDQMQVGGKY